MSGFKSVGPSQAFVADDDHEVAKRIRVMLPKATREKLRAEERLEAQRAGKASGIVERRMSLAKERNELNSLIAFAERDKANEPHWSAANEQNLKDLKTQRDEIVREIDECAKLLEPKTEKLTPAEKSRRARLGKFAPSYRDFLLLQGNSSRFRTFTPDLPKIGKGKSVIDALAEVRTDADSVLDQICAIEAALLDADTIIAGLYAEIDRLAQAPDISGLFRYSTVSIDGRRAQGKVKWPVDVVHSGSLTSNMDVQRGSSLLAWLFGDQIKAKLEKEIRAKAGEGGLSIPERKAKIAALESDLLALHRIEERLFCAAREAGHDVERRKVHPLALLEIVADEAAERKERERIEAISKERADRYMQDRKSPGDSFVVKV